MINRKEIDIIIDVFRPYQPELIGIFGSYARNDSVKNSDIDILYKPAMDSVSLFDHLRIMRSLEDKLKMKVDLLSEGAIHPNLKPSIFKDLKVIYEG